ncbi:MAG: bifunctional folylpolyglutamate synthase/dihydrofolate synthase, partial [Microbacteriaceae bacterium]|nr:bifunctional folylpolyglutamate synthase/dihydrofolate synthase [Microbacteriaceae bacterium]
FGSAQNALPEAILRSALADVTSPGRLQIIDKRPTVLLDAAHNPHGARSLAHSLVNSFGSPAAVGVLSVLADKDARGVLEALEPVLLEVILTESSSTRATDSTQLADLAKEIFGAERVNTADNVAEGWALAKTKVSQDGMIVISGSITLVGDALKLKQQEEAIG